MKLRLRPEVRQDLRDIGDYIALDDRRAARRLVRTLGERCAVLADDPHAGRERADLRQDRSGANESYAAAPSVPIISLTISSRVAPVQGSPPVQLDRRTSV